MSLRWAIQRMRSEFEELPGLKITAPEAAERWDLDLVDEAQIVLDTFVELRFLERSREGAYARRSAGAVPLEHGHHHS